MNVVCRRIASEAHSVASMFHAFAREILKKCLQLLLEVQFLGIFVYAVAVCSVRWVSASRREKQKTSSKSQEICCSTTRVRDANAGAASFLRYLLTFHEEMRLDPQLRRFERLFLTNLGRLNAGIITSFSSILDAITEEQGSFLACRTAFFDRLFVDAIQKHGVKQIIILGAGYDSRAFRYAPLRKSPLGEIVVRVIEVDQAAVQKRKLERLRKGLGNGKEYDELTAGVEFASCDFEQPGALAKSLASTKFDRNVSTLVLWEGVTYYLQRSTVYNNFELLSQLRAGCEHPWLLGYDFVSECCFSEAASARQKALLVATSVINKPLITGLPDNPDEVKPILKKYGITLTKIWTLYDMMAEFFPRQLTAKNPIHMAVVECQWAA